MKKYTISLLLLLSYCLAAHQIMEAKNCTFNFKVTDVNVGFPTLNDDPVPATTDCICPQEVFDTATTVWYGAAAEPTIAINPKNKCNIVAAWQNDRINNGGALEIGVAYTKDGGKTWKRTVVPFQICIGGVFQRVSDVWVSWSADGKTVYLNALPFNSTLVPASGAVQSAVSVSLSHDGGVTWTVPTNLVTSGQYNNEPTGDFPFLDKNSILADPANACVAYSVWDTFPIALSSHSDSFISKTIDQGKNWSVAQKFYDPFPDLSARAMSNNIFEDCGVIGNILVKLPQSKKNKNTLLNFVSRFYALPNTTDDEYQNDVFPVKFSQQDIVVVRSSDNGDTWNPTSTLVSIVTPNNVIYTGGYNYDLSGNIISGSGTLLRTGGAAPVTIGLGSLFGVAVSEKTGRLYVTWQDNRFRPDQLCQIALSISNDDGKTWSVPVRINQTPQDAPNPQAFTPTVAVTKNGYVGFLYTDFRNDPVPVPNTSTQTLTDTWLAIYKEVSCSQGNPAGLEFVEELRLSQQSFIAQNGPDTTLGTMTVGDYEFLAADKDFVAIYTKSFNGPFAPATLFCDDPENNAQVFLDKNLRQAPFVSIVSGQ